MPRESTDEEVTMTATAEAEVQAQPETAPEDAGAALTSHAGDAQGDAADDPRMAAVIDVLKGVYDPEIPVNIYELGLIYGVEIDADGHCEIEMTLTAPACPVAGILPPEVEYRVSQVEGITSAHVEVVWDPPWSMERMSEAARLMLGLD